MKLYAAHLNFRSLATELGVPASFPSTVLQEAMQAHDRCADMRRDAREIPFVTIDPPGSMDLDQAVCIEARTEEAGFAVYYAIADVAAFVEPGGAVEAESIARGQTIYFPDEPARLHPQILSEDRASLLPDVDRPAVLWTIFLDSTGEVEHFSVERVLIRSRQRFTYEQTHADLCHGRLHSSIALLPVVGRLRQASSLRRKAINLRLPAQRVEENSDGSFHLEIEPRYEMADYNSEISLLAGMCAGQLMADAGIGFLRTLPDATSESEQSFRRAVSALGFSLEEQSISEFLLGVDADTPTGMAVMRLAQKLLRGANYAWLGQDEAKIHAGIGGFYAHVTAPLRRLIDRFATEVCLALCNDSAVPDWVIDRVTAVKASMRQSSQLAARVDRAVLDLTEAHVLAPWAGENFPAAVLGVNSDGDTASIFVSDPPVFSTCQGNPPVGKEAIVTLIEADPHQPRVEFAWPAD
ncbi:MAG: RNB domain-containing ribonuclease [Corynebacterium sp.]|nr:RNB domain-containing ribonuclease [Corynebacterium sp.]